MMLCMERKKGGRGRTGGKRRRRGRSEMLWRRTHTKGMERNEEGKKKKKLDERKKDG